MPHWPGPTIVIPDLNERTHWLGNRDAAVWVSSCLSFVLHFNQWTSKLFSWYSLEYSGRLSYLILFSVSRSNSSRSQERLEKQTHLLRYTYVRSALISDYNLSHPKARHYLHRSQFPLISAHSTVTPSICFCFAGFFRYSVLPARLLVSPLFYNYLRMCWHLLLFSSSFDRLFAILFKFQRPQKRLRCRLFLDKCLVLVRVCVR